MRKTSAGTKGVAPGRPPGDAKRIVLHLLLEESAWPLNRSALPMEDGHWRRARLQNTAAKDGRWKRPTAAHGGLLAPGRWHMAAATWVLEEG